MTSSTATRQPQLPVLTDTSAAGLRKWASDVVAAVAALTGQSARTDNARLDQAVTFRDLVDAGIAVSSPTGSSPVIATGSGVGAAPPAPEALVVVRLPFNTRLTWTPASYEGRGTTEVWRNALDNLSTAYRVASLADGISLYEDGYADGALQYYWIRFVSSNAVAGPFNAISGTATASQPGDVTGLSYAFEQGGIRLRFNGVSSQDLDVYEIRVGPNLAESTIIAETRSTTYLWAFQTAGTYRVFVRARNVNQAYSGSAAAVDVLIAAPPAVAPAGSFVGENALIDWAAVQGSFPVVDYEMRHGLTYAGSTLVSRELSTQFVTRATWAGLRRYWITARDAYGNMGAPAAVDLIVNTPAAPGNLRGETSNNLVQLRWDAAAATLPIRTYEVRRGSTLGSSVLIGEKSGLFTAVTEQAAGNYTYYVRAIDSAGNVGDDSSIAVTLQAPPNYVLYSNQDLALSLATLSSALFEAGVIALPVNTGETWDDHYTTRGWTTDQSAITAGYPYYAEPTPTSGYAEWTIDYGAAVPSTAINATFTYAAITGTPAVVVQLSHKVNLGDPWTDLSPGESGFIGVSFRYVKVRFTVTSTDNDLSVISALNVRLSTTIINDRGAGTANAADAGGTLFNFNRTFFDISSINVTVNSTTQVDYSINFTDAPNPTGFRVLVWDTAGARVTKDIYWSADGI